MEGRIVKIERYSLHNGPGIRTTIFLKGCPLRCAWCANPESQRLADDVMVNAALCVPECRECLAVCPAGAIQKPPEKPLTLDRDRCTQCGKCVAVCPTQAITRIGETISVEATLHEICKDRAFYDTSGGGVTLSGGEPLCQPAFVAEVFQQCQAQQIHTVLDTCGYGQWDDFKRILDSTDLILYDLKCIDPAKHRTYTQVENTRILDNLRRVAQARPTSLIIRVPSIPGINDSADDIEQLGEFLDTLSFQRIEILPYHRLGTAKYAMLQQPYPLEAVARPTQEHLETLRTALEKRGFQAKVIV